MLWTAVIISLCGSILMNYAHLVWPSMYSKPIRSIQKYFYGISVALSLLNLVFLSIKDIEVKQFETDTILLVFLVLSPLIVKLEFLIESSFSSLGSLTIFNQDSKEAKSRMILLQIKRIGKMLSMI